MNRVLTSLLLFSFILSVVLVSVASAETLNTNSMLAQAGSQPFFAGYWRCTTGSNLNVTPAFGPWYTYRNQQAGATSQSFIYNDRASGGWVSVGVDSAGGYWTATSPGWRGNQLAYTGSYTNHSQTVSQRQVFTRSGPRGMTATVWRNGDVIAQMSCNK